ncbi:hypothetical protein LIER_36421 [Lithospermum erythrorhizon]|uniref:Uncharacterized protein n=1 Tax=Lithospermum erythrorhizon TaxID=34254 RepID=A0AAV3P616_LITER
MEETYTYTPPVRRENEPVVGQQSCHDAGQQSRHDATTRDAMSPAPSPNATTVLQRKVDALSARVAGETRRGINTELVGLTPSPLTFRARSCRQG